MSADLLHKILSTTIERIQFIRYGVILVAIFFCFSFSYSLAENSVVIGSNSDNTKIVFKASSKNSIIITEGRITAEQGKSVKLLPGTHLKGKEPVKVNIVSKEQQNALAYKAKKEKERKFQLAVFNRLRSVNRHLRGPKIVNSHIPSSNKTFFGQQLLYTSAVLVQTVNSLKVLACDLKIETSIKSTQNLEICAFKELYKPDSSWGSCAETQAIMLC